MTGDATDGDVDPDDPGPDDVDPDDVPLYDSLDGHVALVTGANRGIGAEIAARLADLGATVYAGARDPASVEPPDQRALELDVTDRGEARAAVRTVVDETGRLDVLVNNAGVYGPAGDWADLDLDDVAETYAVNLEGPGTLARYALPHLREASADGGHGRVVNVSSGSGQLATGVSTNRAPYGVSKAALNALTQALARQSPALAVNAVCPGWVRTAMGGERAPRSVAEGAATPVWLARFAPGAPSGLFWRDRDVLEW